MRRVHTTCLFGRTLCTVRAHCARNWFNSKTSGERDLHSMVVVAVGGQRQLRQIRKGSGSFHVGSFLSSRTRQNICGTRSCPQTVSPRPSSTLKALKKCVSHSSSCRFSLHLRLHRCEGRHFLFVPRSDGSRVRETTTTMRRSLPYPARLSRMASAYPFCLPRRVLRSAQEVHPGDHFHHHLCPQPVVRQQR